MNGIAEAQREDCFLCTPNERLVFHRGDSGYALTGLGPQVPGYTVVGTIDHLDSLTDMTSTDLRSHLDYIEHIRGRLIEHYGAPCLLTEHGKTPLCSAEFLRTKHCFHPHALLFPGMPALDADPRGRYHEPQEFPNFADCIEATRNLDQYFLLSPRAELYWLWPTPGDMPAQYARYLVATHLSRPKQVSWREYPEFDVATAYADELRTKLDQAHPARRTAP